MTGLDLWTTGAAGVASVCLGLRANMLKPHFTSWFEAPTRVWLATSLLSMVCAGFAFSIVRGAPADPRMAVVFSVLAAQSAVMLHNLVQNRPGGDAPDAAPAKADTTS